MERMADCGEAPPVLPRNPPSIYPSRFAPAASPILEWVAARVRLRRASRAQRQQKRMLHMVQETETYITPAMQAKISEMYEKMGRLGRMMFTINEVTWTNQNNELVKVTRSTGIKY